MKKSVRVWEIVGTDSTTEIAHLTIPAGRITSDQLKALLQALVAKHSLSDSEIAASFLKRNAIGRADLLEVAVRLDGQGGFSCYECGSNPYFTARIREIVL